MRGELVSFVSKQNKTTVNPDKHAHTRTHTRHTRNADFPRRRDGFDVFKVALKHQRSNVDNRKGDEETVTMPWR